MYSLLESIGEQVKDHTTGLGTIWYILVFGFRLFVVSTVGGAVYGDEQGAFKCSEKNVGCESQCYNQFAKISHIRFWAFQIIAVSTPTVFFHLYVTYVTSQIKKIESAEEAVKKLQADEEEDAEEGKNEKMTKEMALMEKRKRRVGQFKMKEVIRGEKKIQIPQTKKMILANLLNLLIRLVVEFVFIIISANLFNITADSGPLDQLTAQKIFWNEVPGSYMCRTADDLSTKKACGAHITVPCFVSRAYEKTFLLRYMNIIAFICVIITIYEVFALIHRSIRHRRTRKRFEREGVDAFTNMPMMAADMNRSSTKRSLPDYNELQLQEGIYPRLNMGTMSEVETKPTAPTAAGHGKLVKLKRDEDGSLSVFEEDAVSMRSHTSQQKRSRSRSQSRARRA